ncbi:DNA-(apurinic or apyrimidinic site) lyase 2 [Corythoichthys intestinalis]|uniref:DNA-(apurinic or apyrimidinic site) lyase 2 n=1 Tax=Corythoichthys intestinalis TaxID=161448 RepID=UPI0025A5D669|nr:DNA-(apurinic or apyrimidinic site) lyase 2 [Corythoichthys intestinalis]XP_061802005.1 DNA-(apurinic or apyrimidinic site) endonuclease 2-like [Nerophis lumbriciformis]
MKIATWNINGIRTFKCGIKKTLDALDADIICVQETKVTRDLLDERTAIVEGYTSYFSFSRGRSGYSGVATYCKNSAMPFAAEEGLTGVLTNHKGAIGCYGNQSGFTDEELQLLDNEGRAVITQHKVQCLNQIQTLTVINVYCPRADPEKPERKDFKLQFYKLLQARAEDVLKNGSSVIVLGDVNTSHRPIDHCDPSETDDFEENPGRKWLNGFLRDNETSMSADIPRQGMFVDTFRHFYPTRTDAFTCWSTLTGARRTNYGTRIDYIFADYQLAKEQFVAADIMPEVEGSDHCPVWGALRCSLLPSSKPPPLATCHLPEFAGKQQKLSRFLIKVDQKSCRTEGKEELPGSQEEDERRENINMSGTKRLMNTESVHQTAKKAKTLKTSSKPQGNLLAFFKPTNSQKSLKASTLTDEVKEISADDTSQLNTSREQKQETRSEHLNIATSNPRGDKGTSSGFWKSILHGPPPPPACKVHGEPCVLRTVKKEGPNVGRQFFVCSRPQGHSANPEARCNFFAWVDKGK